ncbi:MULTISPECIES: serine hydrolase [unclassified Pedobacter]|uniref:serine hydrolase domain-containing protein n=1 Tax=unclassified Pedobacter TaxID=2628915 RepID=UPI001E06250E|nr:MULTISPECIES: serine hydrolase domain-containing protein [unclassified Pedobacter]CAH0128774.1 D-alanyl-D-alanine carboxypeptidase [Pedobacter sp. Bi36]CAH0183824.1 D-alanyl-D-alanine carboxypeptidase [Pedobacter sp. Bi126]
MKLKFLKYFCITFLIIGVVEQLKAQNANAEAQFKAVMEKYNAVGAAVAVVKEGKIVYTHSFGLKDLENKKPLTDQDIFRIASISKSFSATSIMQLVEAGKISLDDDFGDLVGFKIRNPKFPDQRITLKMALSHTSSLNDSQGYLNLDVINPDKNPNWAKCYNEYAPGSKFDYCNLNFNLIGTIIEKKSGERFDNYVKNHVLKPLGLYAGYCIDSLDSTRFVNLYEYHADTKTYTPSPTAYAPRRTEIANYIMGYSTPVFSPTGGMKISATDLAKYMIMHMNYGTSNGVKIITKKSAKKMQTALTDDEGYGLAIRTADQLIPGVKLKGHTGSAYGLFSTMFFSPKDKFGFVIITNGINATYTDGFPDFSRAAINSLYQAFIKSNLN